jgi:GTPase SAR1 family protein
VRIWEAGSGKLIREFEGAARLPYSFLDVAFRPRDAVHPFFGVTALGEPDILVDVVEPLAEARPVETITQVISAKVVLVGESNVGKSYLAHRIATGKAPEEGLIKSTHGMKFWPLGPEQLCAQPRGPADQRRDVVLWDMGGQEEYRLVHQLFLHDTTVALLLLDPTRGNVAFKDVATWNKYLTKQLRERKARKLLVGAKLDAPSDTLDRKGIEQTRVDTDCASFHETSAITGRGVPELCTAVTAAIDWESLGTTSRPALFQRIRDEIEARRSRGEVVLYLSDLHRALGDEAAAKKGRKAIATVVEQLATQGVIACSRMSTGEQVLVLQVQEIERYAGSLILAARNNPRNVPALELRAISLPGFTLPGIPERDRLNRTQETAVRDCTVELLLEHGICFAHEGLLVFPSLMATSADDDGETLPHAASLYYDISGAIDNIYASLVAWLVLAKDFGRLRLAPGRAEFEVRDQGLCGLRKVAKPGGFAHVDVYFGDKTPARLREDFVSFVEDHLSKQGVELCEHLVVSCPKGFVFDEETLRMAMAEGDRQVICPRCKSHHPLHEGAKEVRARNPKSLDCLWGIRTRMEEARKAATREAVQMVEQGRSSAPEPRPIRLLHLSDLHFTADTPVFRRLQWLLDDVKRDKQVGGLGFADLDYLVVSGDFTDKANPQGFEKAYEFLSELSRTFRLTSERCILVPGNHDVAEPRDAFTQGTDSHGSQIVVRDPVKYPLRFKPFSDGLYHKFLLTAYPLAPKEQGLSIPFLKETGIQFLTFNSCWEIDEFNRKRAGIHPDAVAQAMHQADQQAEAARAAGHLGKNQKPLRIAVWHHAVTAPDFKMNDRNLDILPHLQNHGIRLVLHGDAHSFRRDEVGAWTKPRIHVVGAGSFGASAADKGEAVPRLYNVLEIERDFRKITVHTRRQRTPDGDWDGHAEWPNPKDSDSRVAYYTIDLRQTP